MTKRKRKLSAAEKAAKTKRREEYETVFIYGKTKRVRRPLTIDGISVDDFIRRNADPLFLHQEGLWEYLEIDGDPAFGPHRGPVMTPNTREPA